MTEPPKWDRARVTAAPGNELEQLSRSIIERTPVAGAGLEQGPDGQDGRVLHLKVAGGPGFQTVVFDPVLRPPNLPTWFREEDLEPTLQAHFENTTEYGWGDPFNDFAVEAGYCFEGLFWVVIYSNMTGPIDCRFPAMDGQCVTKLAIVPSGGENIGWHCAEADWAEFEAVVTVEIDAAGKGSAPLPAELTESCEPGTVQSLAVSDADGRPVIGTAHIEPQTSRVAVAVHPPSACGGTALVQLMGCRKGCAQQWPRADRSTAEANARHYGRAYPFQAG